MVMCLFKGFGFWIVGGELEHGLGAGLYGLRGFKAGEISTRMNADFCF